MCQEYATRGAYAYVSMIQREERKNKVLMPYPKVFQKGREWGGRRGKKWEFFSLGVKIWKFSCVPWFGVTLM